MITETTSSSGRLQRRVDIPAHAARDQNQLAELSWQVESTAAIAELMHRVVTARSLDHANLIAANELCAFLRADTVSIGVARPGSLQVQVAAMSDVAHVDPAADLTRVIAHAMSESLIRHRELGSHMTIADPTSARREMMQLAHEELLRKTSSDFAWSCPLIADDRRFIGVWIALFSSRPENAKQLLRFASATQLPLAETLRTTQHATEGLPAKFRRSIREAKVSSTRIRLAVGAAVVCGAMLVPIPHRVSCQSILQPTSQRFAVAPHDGVLKDTQVRAGDLVRSGQLLAEMEATDLELEIADLTARQQRALKKADIHQSEDDPAATQLAYLEASELTAQLELLKHRLTRCQIVSPIDGYVLQCELDDASGAPVRRGDVLMQVAPLDSLCGELEIPESELSHVAIGQQVQVIADGKPLDRISTRIEKIRPISEVRNGQNVFIAEVSLDNADGRLRPGMKGHTKISAGYRAAGWVFLHRAFERAYGSIR